MNWPDTEKAERLMRADGLTGAEMEALAEFLSQPLNDWQFEQEREAVANQEWDSDEGDPEAEGYAENYPVAALLRRINAILQNHPEA